MLHGYRRLLAFVVVLLPLLGSAQSALADTPKLPQAVEVTEMRFLGDPLVGATVNLQVRFTARVDGEADLTLHFPGHLAPLGRLANEKHRTERASLQAGRQYVRTYVMRLDEPGVGMVEFIASMTNRPAGYNGSTRRYLNVEGTRLLARVFERGDTLRRQVTTMKGPGGNASKAKQGQTAQTASQYYTVNVTGTLKYYDEKLDPEGLYGLHGVRSSSGSATVPTRTSSTTRSSGTTSTPISTGPTPKATSASPSASTVT